MGNAASNTIREPNRSAVGIGAIAHTAPAEVGHVLKAVAPRHAVRYHHFNDFHTAPEIEADARQHYSGPLTLARDLMVFNVTKDDVRVRMAIVSEEVWPNKETHDDFRTARRAERPKMSDWLVKAMLFPKR